MVSEVQAWGLKLAWVTGDSWYSSLENLKFLKNEKVGSLLGVSDNGGFGMGGESISSITRLVVK